MVAKNSTWIGDLWAIETGLGLQARSGHDLGWIILPLPPGLSFRISKMGSCPLTDALMDWEGEAAEGPVADGSTVSVLCGGAPYNEMS